MAGLVVGRRQKQMGSTFLVTRWKIARDPQLTTLLLSGFEANQSWLQVFLSPRLKSLWGQILQWVHESYSCSSTDMYLDSETN